MPPGGLKGPSHQQTVEHYATRARGVGGLVKSRESFEWPACVLADATGGWGSSYNVPATTPSRQRTICFSKGTKWEVKETDGKGAVGCKTNSPGVGNPWQGVPSLSAARPGIRVAGKGTTAISINAGQPQSRQEMRGILRRDGDRPSRAVRFVGYMALFLVSFVLETFPHHGNPQPTRTGHLPALVSGQHAAFGTTMFPGRTRFSLLVTVRNVAHRTAASLSASPRWAATERAREIESGGNHWRNKR